MRIAEMRAALAARPRARAGLFLAALMALFWLGPVQLHPPIGWVDPGLYIYWFLDPAGNFAHRGGDYHGARIPFVALGALLYALLDMVSAQAVLVSLFQALALAAIWALSGLVLRGFAWRAAVTALLALNPVWLAAVARGYVDGPSMALGLAGLALLLRREGAAGLAGAGALLAFAFFTHPLGGALAGLSAGAALLALGPSPRRLLPRALWMGLGALGALLAAGVVAQLLGLPFLFLGIALSHVGEAVVAVGPTAFAQPAGEWLGGAVRVALFPLAALMAGLAAWRAWPEGGAPRALAAAALAPLLALLVTIPLWGGFTAQFAFYASYVWLPLLPALLLTARAAEAGGAGSRWAVWAIGLAAGGLLLGLALPLEARDAPWVQVPAWLGVSAGLAGLGLAGTRRPGPGFAAAALVLALAGAATRDTAGVLRLPGGPRLADQQAALAEMHRFLAAQGGLHGDYLLWLGREGFAARRPPGPGESHRLDFAGRTLRLNAMDSLGASLGWHVAALGFDLPSLGDGMAAATLSRHAGERAPIVLLCATEEDCGAARRTLAALGLGLEEEARLPLQGPRRPGLLVLRATLAPRPAGADPSPAQVEAALAMGLDGAPRPGLRPRAVLCDGPRASELTCRALFDGREGEPPATRRLRFMPAGPAAIPLSIGSAEPAVAILDAVRLVQLCRSELRRAALWLDRPDLLPRGAEAAPAFAQLAQVAGSAEPARCFEALAAFSHAFDLDWRPGRLPQAGFACETELAAARALALALEGPLADAAVSVELATAEAARLRGDQPGCMMATARLRAAWYRLFDLPIAAAPPLSPAARLAALFGEEGLRAICRSEAERAGFWFDRPHLAARRPGTEEALRDLATTLAEAPAAACLERLLALEARFDLAWREGHMPLGPMGCETDLAAARRLAQAVPTALADPAIGARLSEAEAALRRGDHAACLQAASRLRATWRARFGLVTPP